MPKLSEITVLNCGTREDFRVLRAGFRFHGVDVETREIELLSLHYFLSARNGLDSITLSEHSIPFMPMS